MRTRSKKATLALLFALAVTSLVLVVPAGAGATGGGHKPKPKPTVVTWNHWAVTTSDDVTHKAPLGGSVTHCASTPVTHLDVFGHVKHTIKNAHFKVQWLLNGTLRDNFKYHWTVGGASAAYAKGIANESGIPDGHWKIQILQNGATTGVAKITLALESPPC